METIVVRKPQRRDYEAWAALWRDYGDFYKGEISEEITTVTWNRIIDQESSVGGLVAQSTSGKLVGFINYVVHRSTWTVGQVCYLEDLFVVEDQRERGVGDMLIHQLIDHARGKFWERVYWICRESNEPARLLFDSVAGGPDGFLRYRVSLEENHPR